MTGTSYDGTLCIAAATTGVEGLEAIIPVAPISNYYDYYRSNGLVRSPDGYLGEDMDVLYDFIHTGDPAKRERNDREVRDKELVAKFDRKTGDYNDFWADRDYLKDMDKVQTAVLMAHGFNDWNVMTSHSQRFYQAAKEKGLPTQMYYHQNGHGGDPSMTMMNRWFTRYLHGVENGVEDLPQVYIVREHEREPTTYSAYPDPNAQDVILGLVNGKNNTGALVIGLTENRFMDTLTDDSSVEVSEMWEEKNADHRLLYLSPVLKEDVRLSGTPKVTVRLASSTPAANLSVYLVSLPWEKGKDIKIYDNIINRSWADPQNHASIREGKPLTPGEFVDVSFDLLPDDQVIRKGQQIGLMIFSSDSEFTILPAPGTQLVIDANGTSITLPVVGGMEALDNAF
jgi:X-Pro dipeptidyl-peptidase